MSDESQTIAEIPSSVASLRETFQKGKTMSYDWRKQQLTSLLNLLRESRDEYEEAAQKDLGRIPTVTKVAETGLCIQEVEYALEHLDEWMKPESKNVPIVSLPAKGYIVKQPYGVVLIIAPWNYPLKMVVSPLIGAIAAGNCVVVKPSEVSANSSTVIKKLMDKYLDNECFRVYEGGPSVSTALLREKFDYIFYTGSTNVGKIIMKAASENLTPVTLELGGKSPVIVDDLAKLDVASKRLMWGKTMNVGQTCVAPDYILVTKGAKDELVEKLKATIKEYYGENPRESPDYSRIINERHAQRLANYIEEEKSNVIFGGEYDVNARYVAPTLILNPSDHSKVMTEEIFGPVLPIKQVENVEEAIQFVNSRPNPLALYIFTENQQVTDTIVHNTKSGGVGINSTILHIACPEMPFGGVGNSGFGHYNGRTTFETFSHSKSILDKSTWIDPDLVYPPYTKSKIDILGYASDGIKLNTSSLLAGTAAMLAGALYIKSKL